MQHTSVKLNTPCEFINVTPINPLISKCQIKVCYVGDTANRNKSIITKETARGLANSLPGSPIVGYFDEQTNDFDQHTKEIQFKNNKLVLKEKTKPYGFVDLNAKCWFQKYIDDGADEREYLMTEGYLWTGQYPECQRVVDKGNNQSMELDKDHLDAHWTRDINGKPEFFIINEGLISKLCILGEKLEPCFEGANITEPKIEFSLEDSFKEELSSMIFQLQEILDKGGNENMAQENIKQVEEQEVTGTEFANEDKKDEKPANGGDEKKCPDCGKPVSECTCDDKKKDEEFKCNNDDDDEKKRKYSLDEIPEYVDLQTKYAALEAQAATDAQTIEDLKTEISGLKEFKANIEKKDKEEMIKSFYMLSDEDKQPIIDKIDEYSLEDIEAKLSVICFRNKVNFNLEEEDNQQVEETQEEDPLSYNLDDAAQNVGVPAWIQAVRATKGTV